MAISFSKDREFRASVGLALVLCAMSAIGQPTTKVPTFEVDGKLQNWQLTDSRYGYVPQYNLDLATELDQCEGSDKSLVATIRISPEKVSYITTQALSALNACRSAKGSALAQSLADVNVSRPPPTVLQRAFVLASRASPLTPDYDRTFWDLTGEGKRRSSDPDSLFTWGPYRATAGQGCTLQSILRRLAADRQTQPILVEAFTTELNILESLLVPGCNPDRIRKLLLPIASDPERREAFQVIFARLGDSSEVRKIYDDFFYGRRGARLNRITEYAQAWKLAGKAVTEIDIAFFLERSLQFGSLKPAEVRKFAQSVDKTADPWEVRQIASNTFNFPNQSQRAYQTGRDATYFIEGALVQRDRSSVQQWLAQSRVRASDVGLTEKEVEVCSLFPLPTC